MTSGINITTQQSSLNPPNNITPTQPFIYYYPTYAFQNGSFHIVPNYCMPPPPIGYPYNVPIPPNFNHFNYIQQPQVSNNNILYNKPEEFKYHCSSCDRGYRTQFKYNEHVAQHVKCPAENCTYSACENLVEFHYKWQHVTGLASKCWGNTPEEIEEWRKNRKKNFPTETKIMKKRALKAKLASKYAASKIVYQNKAQLHGQATNPPCNNFPRYGQQNSYNRQHINSYNQSYNRNQQSSNQASNFHPLAEQTNCQDNVESTAPSNGTYNNAFHHNNVIKRYRERSLKYLAKAANHKLPLGSDTSQWRRKYTLLERLLSREIKAERELMLKCVNYVAKHVIPTLPSVTESFIPNKPH